MIKKWNEEIKKRTASSLDRHQQIIAVEKAMLTQIRDTLTEILHFIDIMVQSSLLLIASKYKTRIFFDYWCNTFKMINT